MACATGTGLRRVAAHPDRAFNASTSPDNVLQTLMKKLRLH
jgi:hypothetical protein